MLAPAAVAQEPRRGEHREAGVHVHGAASLALATDGAELTVELQSPLYNLVGFERPQATPAEITAWMDAALAVRQPAQIIALPAEADCRLAGSSLGVFSASTREPGAPAAPDGAHQAPGHAHDHTTGKDSGDGFEDVLLSWTFRCRNIKALGSFEATALRTFPRLTSLDTAYLDAAAQKAGVLTRESTRFRIR